MTKIGIITSRGGHLFQLYQLKDWWRIYNRFWVTLPGSDVASLLKDEKKYFAYGPESRNITNSIKNLFLAIRILRKEKPDLLISCGAGIAPPFFYIAKLFRIKLIFMEPYDFIKYSSLSSRLVLPIIDIYLVQHTIQKKYSSKAKYFGSTL